MAMPDWVLTSDEWPETCDAAARDILAFLSPVAREKLRSLPRHELVRLHFGLGLTIRNRQGLWRKNRALLQSCTGSAHGGDPDEASMAIIRRAWQLLQAAD
jgi:hypothetical protein